MAASLQRFSWESALWEETGGRNDRICAKKLRLRQRMIADLDLAVNDDGLPQEKVPPTIGFYIFPDDSSEHGILTLKTH